ncbi:MAG: protein-L-isoaspartate(D-aspartate) O-methyltransferase [Hyphomicrobiales bacterium]|jgi:protein-L-isoaspartate(D-aspartate) O-methyltransferase|nr:protein-L-isoaspartate(D-aspartate) O-methyltransferase [Hyphomicrobiales bacterium]
MVDYAQARRTMVDCQVRPSDVTDLRIIAALLDVPREQFVPPSRRAIAYLDLDLAVADGSPRALLKPMVFAKLLQAAEIHESDRVLDVGCTTGYSAAVLAKLAANVVALEEDPALARIAAENLGARVAVAGGPLNAGWQADAPYDAILLEGASEVRPDRLLAQLKEGGRLVAVIGSAPLGKATLFRKDSGQITALALFDAAAPLLPGFAKTPAFVF